MSNLKALEVLRRELQNNYEKRPFMIKTELYNKERIEDFHEAIEELEALETKDRLAELEKVILDYYLAKGYQVGKGDWRFKVQIDTDYKSKWIAVWFDEGAYCSSVFHSKGTTTKEMFDRAFEFFSLKAEKC